MTPEERHRMNDLSLAIQEETNYEKFAAMITEMSELIARKEQRRFHEHPRLVWQRNRPSRTMAAVVNKILPPRPEGQSERVEISVSTAEELFREVRIENVLTNVDGKPVALKNGAHVDVTFETNLRDTITVERMSRAPVHSPKTAAYDT